jgi:hypothetical protein
MCGYGGYHVHHGHAGWCCCGPTVCGPGFPFGRRFPSREEHITWLEEYLKNLQAEAKAVEERIAEWKAAG